MQSLCASETIRPPDCDPSRRTRNDEVSARSLNPCNPKGDRPDGIVVSLDLSAAFLSERVEVDRESAAISTLSDNIVLGGTSQIGGGDNVAINKATCHRASDDQRRLGGGETRASNTLSFGRSV